MCVSAKASFALASVLLPVGAFCITTALRRNPSLIALAATPLLFGIQQICEGLVWVGIDRDDGEVTRAAALGYLFFALCFWLFWMPFSAMVAEKQSGKRTAFAITAVIGSFGGIVAFAPLILDADALFVTTSHHSIRYDISRAAVFDIVPQFVWHLAYLAVIVYPLFASSQKGLLGYDIALVLSAILSHIYFWYSFESVWCFFAACLSVYIAFLLVKLPRSGDASRHDS